MYCENSPAFTEIKAVVEKHWECGADTAEIVTALLWNAVAFSVREEGKVKTRRALMLMLGTMDSGAFDTGTAPVEYECKIARPVFRSDNDE